MHKASFDTVKQLNNIGIKTTGYGANLEEATKPVIIKNGSSKVAIIVFVAHPQMDGMTQLTLLQALHH